MVGEGVGMRNGDKGNSSRGRSPEALSPAWGSSERPQVGRLVVCDP